MGGFYKKTHHVTGGFKGRDSVSASNGSTEADLSQDTLTSEKLSAKADDETKHGKTAIPGFSEINEAKARCVVRHVKLHCPHILTNRSVLLAVPLDTFRAIGKRITGGLFFLPWALPSLDPLAMDAWDSDRALPFSPLGSCPAKTQRGRGCVEVGVPRAITIQ